MSVVQNFTVTGMTCGHCVQSVTEEVSALTGVTAVDVVLESGALSVTSEHGLDAELIKSAVADAGYTAAE